MTYIKIGTSWEGEQHAFELEIKDYMSPLIPPDSISHLKFNPHKYFITSGDAIQKTLQLIEELELIYDEIKTSDNPEIIEYTNKVRKTLDSAGRMHADLVKARGTALFFETEWSQQERLICLAKNPRARSNKLAEIIRTKQNQANVVQARANQASQDNQNQVDQSIST